MLQTDFSEYLTYTKDNAKIEKWLSSLTLEQIQELTALLYNCDCAHSPDYVSPDFIEDWLEEYGGERSWYTHIFVEGTYVLKRRYNTIYDG